MLLVVALVCLSCPQGTRCKVRREEAKESNLLRSLARQFVSFEPMIEERSKKIASLRAAGLAASESSGATSGESGDSYRQVKGRQMSYQPAQYQLLAPKPQAYEPAAQAAATQLYAAAPTAAAELDYAGAQHQPGSQPLANWSRRKGLLYSGVQGVQADSDLPVLGAIYELRDPEVKVFSTKSSRKNSNPYKTVVSFKSAKATISPVDQERMFQPEFYVQEEAKPMVARAPPPADSAHVSKGSAGGGQQGNSAEDATWRDEQPATTSESPAPASAGGSAAGADEQQPARTSESGAPVAGGDGQWAAPGQGSAHAAGGETPPLPPPPVEVEVGGVEQDKTPSAPSDKLDELAAALVDRDFGGWTDEEPNKEGRADQWEASAAKDSREAEEGEKGADGHSFEAWPPLTQAEADKMADKSLDTMGLFDAANKEGMDLLLKLVDKFLVGGAPNGEAAVF